MRAKAANPGWMRALAGLGVLLGAACTFTTNSADAGIGGGVAGSQTVGEQCETVVTDFCTQAMKCGYTYAVNDCVTDDTPMCCDAGSACSEISPSSPATVEACTSAIDALDCNSFANNVVPSACAGVGQLQ
jgi:hypothetical protein